MAQEQEIQELLRELERLRQRLHSFIGSEYRPERLQEARELSDRLDELVVRYTKLKQGACGQSVKQALPDRNGA